MGAAANYRCYASILSSLTVQNWFVPLRASSGASAALIRYGEKGTRAGTGVGRSAPDFARNSASRQTFAPDLSLMRTALPVTGKRCCGISGGARPAPPFILSGEVGSTMVLARRRSRRIALRHPRPPTPVPANGLYINHHPRPHHMPTRHLPGMASGCASGLIRTLSYDTLTHAHPTI